MSIPVRKAPFGIRFASGIARLPAPHPQSRIAGFSYSEKSQELKSGRGKSCLATFVEDKARAGHKNTTVNIAPIVQKKMFKKSPTRNPRMIETTPKTPSTKKVAIIEKPI
jgi:hypothetical protein